MYLTPIINEEDLFLDMDMQPLVNGKVICLDPISNNEINIYTYSDDDYTIATNPLRLDVNGRPEHTYFSDRLTYIRVYKYQGLDENNHEIFEFVRDYLAGANEKSESREYVTTIEALKDLDPSINHTVNVLGYYEVGDCEMRTYIWDENSTLDQDGGYVIASDVTAAGRWLLQFDGPYIPSSYYGVWPSHTSNINALATFIGEINGKATAPGIYMIPGNYGDTSLITTKKVLLFSNTQISSIECSWIDVKGKPSTWIGNIFPSDSSCPVHSSWYKHARSFWGCGSKHKYCDGRNWIDNAIVANMGQSNVTFYTDGSPALVTDTGDNRLTFTGCKHEGPGGFLHKDSKCRFIAMEFTDKLYSNSSITPANIEFSTLSGQTCSFNPDNFTKIENMAAVAYKGGITDIDMGNYYCGTTSNVDLTEYITVRNLNANYALLGKNGGTGITVKDSKIGYLTFNGNALSVSHSNVKLMSFPYINSLSVGDNSTIQGGWTLNRGTVTCVNSIWNMTVNEATDNTTLGPKLTFRNSTITGVTIASKNAEYYDCRLTNSVVKVYPYKQDNKYWLFLRMERCDNDNSNETPVQFTKIANDNACMNCWWDVRIIDSDFSGDAKGISCPYYANQSSRTLFIARGGDSVSEANNNYRIEGNRGNCPYGGDARLTIKSSADYNYNCNLDPWVSNNYAVHIGGAMVRMWLAYQSAYGFAQPERYTSRQNMRLRGTIIAPKDGQDYSGNTYQYNEQPAYNWRVTMYPNASFAENCLDPAWEPYTPSSLDEIDDWFACRVMRPSDSTKNMLFLTY